MDKKQAKEKAIGYMETEFAKKKLFLTYREKELKMILVFKEALDIAQDYN